MTRRRRKKPAVVRDYEPPTEAEQLPPPPPQGAPLTIGDETWLLKIVLIVGGMLVACISF